ncbi:MAG: helix-turn-helix transcriptional regulator [Pseudomonas sp.]|jgi:DNA-binding CsgD family transcriptional regulator|nr:helix-turn-helix transcriptional regulator [Pseudomonas sp.]MDD2222035.1 helix-turn-helix transcriptional regulator [Pseudomonas sp.]MDY0414860.1 helix-turn-helix transcriptional regulator [Pseudomonas sp.]NLO53800.1 helix-turn-helix transcriptional regulator [Gammaproteobacteria bacterium]
MVKHYDQNSSTLLDLVGLLYEAISESNPWYSFADCLRQMLGAKAVSVTLHHSPDLAYDIQVMAVEPGDQVDWLAAERTYREQFAHIDLLQPKHVEPGQILTIDSTMVSRECADYFASLGIHGSLRTCFSEPSAEMRCWIDIICADQTARQPFYAQALELLNLLSTHLTRALGLYVRLQRQETQRDIYETSLDHLSLGCLMLDSQAKVLCTNQAAKDIINQYCGLAISQQQFTLHDKSTQDEFNRAVKHAISIRAPINHTDDEQLIRVRLADGMLLGILVAPAPLIPHYQGKRVPNVIIYLVELGDARIAGSAAKYESTSASVARLFGLTPQEGKLALLLAAGRSITEASEQLGVAVSAARNYSKSIYAKLDIRGQSDLVRLICKSFVLLR